jgi:hypothetical protein
MRPFAERNKTEQRYFAFNHRPPRQVRNRVHRLAPRRGNPFIRLPPAPSAGGGADPIVNSDPADAAAVDAAPKPVAGGAAALAPAPNVNGVLPVVVDGSVVLPVAGEAG